MTRVEKLKTFAVNHPVITFLGCFVYGFILGLCIIHDLRYYGIIKK